MADRTPTQPPSGLAGRLALAFVLFGGLGALALLGPALLGPRGPAGLSRLMGAGVGGPMGPVLAVLGFTGLAFIGAPQFVLIGVAVLAFGPVEGFALSWIGTLISAAVGFLLGRRFGSRLLDEHAGGRARRTLALVGRNGFWASLLIRLAPSAPFIVVNMAAGMTPMRLLAFLAGTSIGIVPKIALTAFAGGALQEGAARGSGLRLMLLGLAGAAWLALGLGAGLILKAARTNEAERAEAPRRPAG